MLDDPNLPNLSGIASVIGILGLTFVLGGFVALGRKHLVSCTLQVLLGSAMVAIGALLAALVVGVHGYLALTHEEVAALISVRPSGPQRFDAKFRFPDGREAHFVLAGDALYVDAHILKWTPVANLIGLHTSFQLDRVAGRYRSVEQERTGVRTVFPLRERPLVDLFDLRSRYAMLAPLYDTAYGSASFVTVDRPAELELRVSTTGLLLREVPADRR